MRLPPSSKRKPRPYRYSIFGRVLGVVIVLSTVPDMLQNGFSDSTYLMTLLGVGSFIMELFVNDMHRYRAAFINTREMLFYHQHYLRYFERLCRQNGVEVPEHIRQELLIMQATAPEPFLGLPTQKKD